MESEIKVVLLGDSGVGKTSIVDRYVTGMASSNLSTTIAAANSTKHIVFQGQEYDLMIWDTAGQEIYRGLAPLYYRNANVAIIVFDITKKTSFEAVTFWIDELHENIGSNVTIILCGNKCDLYDNREISVEDIEENVNLENIIYVETSCITGEGIECLFERSISEAIGTRKDITISGNINFKPQVEESSSCC